MGEPAERAELLACRLTLRPLREGWLLPGSGRAVQAWWLGRLAAAEPALAERLHAGSQRRPYSCSPVIGLPLSAPGSPAPVSPERAYAVRLAAWDKPLVAHLAALLAAPPAELTLGDVPFTLTEAALDPASPATFAGLAARYLLPDAARADEPGDITLRFLSATSFRQAATEAGRPAPLPFPLPAQVWGGLFDRWQSEASVRLEPALRPILANTVAVGRFAGESQRVLLPGIGERERRTGATGGRWVVGFVGQCSYWAPRRDGYLRGALRLLAAFAEFAGVGQGTAYGLGQTRWVQPRRLERREPINTG